MKRILALAIISVLAAACGDGGGGGDIDSPCDLTDAATVQSLFGGTVTPGVEGEARNCEFAIEGGLVESVHVFHFGSSDSWDSTRGGFADNGGGVTDVPGIGEEAFYPNNRGATSLVVSAGGTIFEVDGSLSIFDQSAPSPELLNAVSDLAKSIADSLG